MSPVRGCHGSHSLVMAYGKKRTRSGRFLKRKSYGRKRLVRRKSVRRIKRRGGVYTKKTRFPAKNPFGDRALVKLRFNFNGYLSGDGASTQASASRAVNDLSVVWNYPDSMSKGFDTYPKLFKRYRVNGVMVKLTLFQIQPSNLTAFLPGKPVLGFIIPYSTLDGAPGVVAQNAGSIKQERHTAWGNVKNWGQGGGPTTIKKFLKMKTLVASNLASTDVDYAGTTDLISNPYNSPAITWQTLFGITSVAGVVLEPADSWHYNVEMTYYVEYFEQTWQQQSL